VVSRDPDALATAVMKAAPLGPSLAAATWVRDRFSAARMVGEVAALYEELLS
jgi:hypothetical protein